MPICTNCGHDNREGARFCEQCASALVATPALGKEQRKTVTVLFCDLTGSTALGETIDPERLRALLARYFERMKEIVERHGGSVEKFIGDAVMAVFGVPVVHEDDALRAVRAAAEMRDALPELGPAGADRRHDRRGGDGHRGAARDRRRGERRGAARAGGAAGRGADRCSRRSASSATRSRSRPSSRSSSRARPSRFPRTGSSHVREAPGAAARHALRRPRARARDPSAKPGSACWPSSAASS